MADSYRAIPVTDRVYWVGAIDWTIRNFHGYQTSRGTTYNAYLVMGDEPVLIDTVKAPFLEEMLARVASVVEPAKIRHVVSTHTEMDHTGSLPAVLHRFKPETLVASVLGAKALKQHFHWDRDVRTVADGETLDLGGASFTFLEARMLHWPDSMFAYLQGDGVLFPNDGFGMHLASSERFADELSEDVLTWEASKYFANILLLFSPQVTKLLEKLPGLGLDIRIIAPDHGPVWRKDTGWIVQRYETWAAQRPTKKAVVVYDTMWQSTDRMARAVGDGLTSGGVRTRLLPLQAAHRSDVATELLDAGALLVGSPTMNNQIFPSVADVMTYLKGLRPRNLVGAAFGSFGWSGEAVKHLNAGLDAMNIDRIDDGVRVAYVPDGDALARCHDLGRRVAQRMIEKFDLDA